MWNFRVNFESFVIFFICVIYIVYMQVISFQFPRSKIKNPTPEGGGFVMSITTYITYNTSCIIYIYTHMDLEGEFLCVRNVFLIKFI